MSDAPEGGNTNSGDTPPADEFTPITSQDDLNRIIGERVKRATSKYADYTDLKAKASKLDEIEAANQTEVERAAARIAELESQMQSAQREALRRRIAGDHGITDADDIDLFLTGSDEETLTRQAERLAARNDEAVKPRAPRPDLNQGRQSGGTASTADQFAAAIEGQFTR